MWACWNLSLVFVAVGALFLDGCASTRIADGVPEWVTSSQKRDGMLCAVGASEPTFYVEDAKSYAAENARKELARILSVDIKSIMIDIATGRGSSVDEATVMQVSSWTTSAVLRESHIIEYWYDEKGIANPRAKGMTYALGCVPADFAAREIAHNLKLEDKEAGRNTEKELLERLEKANVR